MTDEEIIMTQAQIDEIESKWPAHEASWEDVHNLVVEVMRLRKRAQEWALYAFNHHGDDANLYNGLADLGGVDRDGRGWISHAAAPAPVPCPNCGGMGETTHDILVDGTEHDAEQRECGACKGTGLAAQIARIAERQRARREGAACDRVTPSAG